jgi:3-hydroxybutyryl-CoA dehydratase
MSTETTAIDIGFTLPVLTKHIGQRKIDAYSIVRANSIHTDEEWARKKGFRAPLAQGMMSTAYVSELMVKFLGEGFVRGGKIAMNFIQPVYAGDRLTVHGVVKEKLAEGDATRVVVEVWCENQDGDMTAVGTASGLVR